MSDENEYDETFPVEPTEDDVDAPEPAEEGAPEPEAEPEPVAEKPKRVRKPSLRKPKVTPETPAERLARLRATYTLTHADVMEKFGMSKSTLRAMIRSGEIDLSYIQFGGATSPVFYDPTAVDAALEAYVARLEPKAAGKK